MDNFLFLAQLPPPVHGASTMNAKSLEELKTIANVTTINLSSARSLGDIGMLTAKKIWLILKLYFQVFKTIKSSRPNFVYFALCPTGLAFYRDIIFIGMIKLYRIPIVYHLHGKGIADAPIWNRPIYKFVFNNSDVIHLSKRFWNEVSEYCPKTRFHVIPNSAKSPNQLSHIENHSSRNACTNFLFLSNYLKGKGPILLLEATKELFTKKQNCKVTLAGDWVDQSTKNEIENWVSGNLEIIESGFLTISGPVFGTEKHKLLTNSDVMVFPSYIDTFPLVLLEAQAYGLAIISTDSGAIPEILDNGNAGIICPQKDVSALTNAMISFIENPSKLNKYKATAFNRYKNNYTEEAYANNFLKTIQTILNSYPKA